MGVTYGFHSAPPCKGSLPSVGTRRRRKDGQGGTVLVRTASSDWSRLWGSSSSIEGGKEGRREALGRTVEKIHRVGRMVP